MEATEKIFKSSPRSIFGMLGRIVFLVLLMLLFIYGEMELWLHVIAALICVVAFWALVYDVSAFTTSLRISNSELVARTLFNVKSLEWDAIARASARGNDLILYNSDGSIKMFIASQLKGYVEILNSIFKKRPDLFKKDDIYISNGLISGLGILIWLALSVAFVIFASDWFLKAVWVVCGIYALVAWFQAPKSILLENEFLLVSYLFRETRYPAHRIDSITLEEANKRDSCFVRIHLRTGRKIDLSVFPHGGIMEYLPLKRWHRKALSNSADSPSWPQ